MEDLQNHKLPSKNYKAFTSFNNKLYSGLLESALSFKRKSINEGFPEEYRDLSFEKKKSADTLPISDPRHYSVKMSLLEEFRKPQSGQVFLIVSILTEFSCREK